MKRVILILFCTQLYAQHTKLPMNIFEVVSLENTAYTVPAGHVLQTLPLGTEEDPFDGTTQPGTVGINNGVSGGWWTVEKILLTEGDKISSSISAGALLYDLGSLKANIKSFKVLWYDESYIVPENTLAEIYSVYSAGINGNPDESTYRKVTETEDKALVEGMVLVEGTSIKSWGVISLIEYDENNANNEIGVLSFVPEAGNVGVRLSSANANLYGDIGNNALDLTFSNSDDSSGATGDSSVALGENTTASGDYSTAIGTASIASGEKSIAIGNQYQTNATTPEYNNEAAGSRSFVIGNNNSTTGAKAFSIGTDNLSTGVSSIALGENNIASGNFSQAIGLFSESTAYSSFAIGNNAFADGYNTTAIGTANTADVNADPLNWSLNNRAFVIGNGYYDVASATLNRSDALTVLFDGTTTISGSVIAPAFIGDGSQLTNLPDGFDGDYTNLTNKPLIRDIVASNPVFLGDMVSAFGTEQVTNRATLDIVADSDGDLITGFKNIGSGDRFNISLDTNNEYAEVGSGGGYGLKLFSEGGNMIFEGDDMMSTPSFNFNGNITNTGTVTAANFIGDGSQLTNLPDGFDGDYTNLTNSPLTFNTSGTGGIQSTGAGSITPSGNLASGTLATALGNQTRATSAGVLAIGQWNAFDDTIDGAAADPSHQAFVIGNGNGNGRSNAFEVLYDGTTTIAGDVVINSDMRLKANIISLGSTLSKLLQIDGKTYTMKKDENKKQKIGVLAQDVQKVFPELVSESNGIKSVNYQGLVPVLINALKEQDAKMKEQESKYLEQEKRLERLEHIISEMDK